MSDSKPNMLKNCALTTALVLLLLVLLLAKCRADYAHPSDDTIIAEFAERRADYETLRDMMLAEDRVTRVGRDFIWIDGSANVRDAERARYLPDARFDRYRALFDALDLDSGTIRTQDGSVGFLRSSRGIVTSGSGKRILWSPHAAPPLLGESDGDTDEQECPRGSPCIYFRRLADDWYLAYESD